MAELVKRNGSGRQLSGQLFDVNLSLIDKVRTLAPDWAGKSNKKIAGTIVNGVPPGDLDRPSTDGISSRAIFHMPGDQKLTLPVVICTGEKHTQLFLGDERKIKQA